MIERLLEKRAGGTSSEIRFTPGMADMVHQTQHYGRQLRPLVFWKRVDQNSHVIQWILFQHASPLFRQFEVNASSIPAGHHASKESFCDEAVHGLGRTATRRRMIFGESLQCAGEFVCPVEESERSPLGRGELAWMSASKSQPDQTLNHVSRVAGFVSMHCDSPECRQGMNAARCSSASRSRKSQSRKYWLKGT